MLDRGGCSSQGRGHLLNLPMKRVSSSLSLLAPNLGQSNARNEINRKKSAKQAKQHATGETEELANDSFGDQNAQAGPGAGRFFREERKISV